MSTPQLILTLAPGGHLQAELPGPNGARRKVELRSNSTGYDAIRRNDESAAEYIKRLQGIIAKLAAEPTLESTLRRMLQAQLRSQIAIGEDGAPTAHQVRHWERHQGGFADPSCPFCISEGRFAAPLQCKTTRAGKDSAKGSVKSNKVIVPDPAGGLIPVLMTRREARKHGWRPASQASSANLSDTGL